MITLRAEMSQRYPTPPVFCRKSPQATENKRGERRKERQERKRVRKSVRTRDLLEGQGAPRERGGRNGAKARVKREEKSLASVGECIIVGAGFADSARFFLALRRGRLKVGRA